MQARFNYNDQSCGGVLGRSWDEEVVFRFTKTVVDMYVGHKQATCVGFTAVLEIFPYSKFESYNQD
jgi:hypothetical protein